MNSIDNLINQEGFRDLFDHAHDMIHMVDLEGRLMYVNKSWSRLLEYSINEIEGRSIYSFVAEEDRPWFTRYRSDLLNGKQFTEEINIRFKSKTGRQITVEGSVSVREEDGRPAYTRGIFHDVTARIRHEESLKERERNLQQLLLNAPDAIVVIDKESSIKLWNPQAERMFGWTEKEVLNQHLSGKIVPPQYREAHEKGMRRYLATGEKHVINNSIEITALDKSGREFYVSLTISATTQNGEVAFIAFIRDIHEQKLNNEELQRKRIELEASNQQLEQFAHVASHDMKEPIRKIRYYSDLLEGQMGNDKDKRLLAKISSSANRLNYMVEGVLNYASASGIDHQFTKVDLNNIIKEIQEDLEILIRDKKATISTKVLPVINGDAFLMYQMFYNLINNSLKFTRPDKPAVITITSTMVENPVVDNVIQEGCYISITLQDNGIGFKPEYASSIFKTFARLHSRSQYEGTGLGLSLVKRIALKHGGFIYAEGEEGRGARFTILLKRSES